MAVAMALAIVLENHGKCKTIFEIVAIIEKYLKILQITEMLVKIQKSTENYRREEN